MTTTIYSSEFRLLNLLLLELHFFKDASTYTYFSTYIEIEESFGLSDVATDYIALCDFGVYAREIASKKDLLIQSYARLLSD